MVKNMLGKRFAIAATVIGLMLLMVFAWPNGVKAVESHTGNAMWIDPPTLNFTTNGATGSKFNVTVYGNVNVTTFTYQCMLHFDPSQIVCDRAGYTATATSQFFAGHTTFPVPVVINNATGSVTSGETLLSPDSKASGDGSIMWVEFTIISAPPTNGTLSSTLYVDPSTEFSFFLGPELDILVADTFNATYTLTFDATPPTIQAPTQTPPVNNVGENEAVTVSVNVTDDGGVNNVTLFYTSDNVTWTDASMTLNSTTNLWDRIIPGYLNGTTVQYKITAFDNAGNMGTYPAAPPNPSYTVLPELTFVMLIVLLTTMTAMIVMLRKRFVRSL